MSYLFKDCQWSQDSLQYDPNLYDIQKNRVIYNDEEYEDYYLKSYLQNGEATYTKYNIENNTEITDAQNIYGGYISEVVGTGITNPTISGDINRLIIPPDLFYGLISNISSTTQYDSSQGVKYALACSTPLNGIIPTNIFKNNKTVNCDNLWKGQTIIPQLIKTWEDNNTTYNVYVHYPQNYTNNNSLSEVFNSEYIVLQDSISGQNTIVNYSVVLLQDSIPKTVTTLSNAFSGQTRWSYIGQTLSDSSSQQFNFFAKIQDNQIIFGLDPEYFQYLYMDSLFKSNYIGVVKGNLFVSNFDIGQGLKVSSVNSKILNIVGGLSGYKKNSISKFMILPKTTSSISQFADSGYSIQKSQITDSSNSSQYYTNSGWIIES